MAGSDHDEEGSSDGKRNSSRNSQAAYLLGSKPSSVDALLFGHLALHLSSPVSPPQLRAKVRSWLLLCPSRAHKGMLQQLRRASPVMPATASLDRACLAVLSQILLQLQLCAFKAAQLPQGLPESLGLQAGKDAPRACAVLRQGSGACEIVAPTAPHTE